MSIKRLETIERKKKIVNGIPITTTERARYARKQSSGFIADLLKDQ